MVIVTEDVKKRNVSRLFTPAKIGGLTINNRTVMAPLGLVSYSDDQGGFNKNAQDIYIRRAKGGVGMITVGLIGCDYVDFADGSVPCAIKNPLVFMNTSKEMLDKIHSYGTKAICMISAGSGRSSFPGASKQKWAPSENENRFDPKQIHRAMTHDEITHMIEDFVKSAVICQQSGFDGIEIHAVHEGYLFDQFAMSLFNRRTDEYGGSLENRLRIVTDIVKGIKAQCGEDFPVSIRFSLKSFIKELRVGGMPGEKFEEKGRDISEGLEAAKILEAAGYDMLNVDAGTYDAWFWNHPPMYFNKKGIYNTFGAQVKEAVNIPVGVAGRMDDPEVINDALDQGIDLIEFGRPLLADPDLPNKIKADAWEDIRPCISCQDGCLARLEHGLPFSCTVNPATGREAEYRLTVPLEKKNILIIGGGPAGLETAWISGKRGHNVTLMEATSELGGELVPGSAPDFKSNDRELIEWFKRQLSNMNNVEIKLNSAATKKDFNDNAFGTIVVATGSKPIIPDFGSNQMITAADVLLKKTEIGNHVTIIGGGLVGCETALMLKKQGKNVSIVEMRDDICGGVGKMSFANYQMLKQLIPYNNIDLKLNTKVDSVDGTNVIVETSDGNKQTINSDTVVCALGYKPNNIFSNLLSTSGKETYLLGDSRHVDNIMQAIWDAYAVAKDI
ncbi:FAD-dependent oxidoreductase [Companilactobacillus mishanensis]|uniref:oxidoreductase n=1 Tax=Companilactobacillus mishanensis TaxID=2486008 RepID=UPI0012953F8A|nr:FAD-dependent oxidoreductase [Companilactobacillus mishanensis]MQS89059.1 FAD-dependent oxidoreductase [Companilactobacillus mishanensis]